MGVLKLAKTRTEDLGMEYLEDYIKDANQKLLKQEELPSLQGLSFFENVTFLNTYDYGISIILFGWDSYLWFHYRESPCSSYALVIPLYFGILIFSTYFDDFVAFIMTELSDRSTLSFSELFQIAFLCALPALITYLSLFILACFNLYYFISTVFERECSPFVRWTNLGIFLFSLLHLYVKLKILKAFKRENTREKKDLPLAIKKEIEKELHVPKITPPSFDDLFGMVQDVDRFHDEIWILRCCNPFKSKKPEYSYI